jgi:hypothetical protein
LPTVVDISSESWLLSRRLLGRYQASNKAVVDSRLHLLSGFPARKRHAANTKFIGESLLSLTDGLP